MLCLRSTARKAPHSLLLACPSSPPAFVPLPRLQKVCKLSSASQSRPRVTLVHRNDVLSKHNPGGISSFSTISAVLLPPVVFSGLIVVLWTWKCFMMVLFQNKIIYMPFLPPNARSDTISEYQAQCWAVKWKEEHIKSGDGTNVALAISVVGSDKNDAIEKVVLYFQGNASSLPPRLPDISQVLRLATKDEPSLRVKFIGVSYRGYWKSGGRPSELGMHQDAEAALRYALRKYTTTRPLKVVIWGQSIGCAFASHLAAGMIESPSSFSPDAVNVQLETLILETPFTSASEMLKTLYPQKWLPYRYLSIFLWNRLDTIGNLRRIGEGVKDGKQAPYVVVLEGGKDELVPREHGDEIERILKQYPKDTVTVTFARVRVEGALHTQILAKGGGRVAAAKAICQDSAVGYQG